MALTSGQASKWLLLIAISINVLGCGQSGPLYLPEQQEFGQNTNTATNSIAVDSKTTLPNQTP